MRPRHEIEADLARARERSQLVAPLRALAADVPGLLRIIDGMSDYIDQLRSERKNSEPARTNLHEDW
jgi:hypothetical protein